jgi:hypothetical protein
LIIFYVVPAESLLEDLMLLAYILTKLQLLGAIWSLTWISCYILLLKHDYFTFFLLLDWISQDICCAVTQGRKTWFRNYNSFYIDVSIWAWFRFTITKMIWMNLFAYIRFRDLHWTFDFVFWVLRVFWVTRVTRVAWVPGILWCSWSFWPHRVIWQLIVCDLNVGGYL